MENEKNTAQEILQEELAAIYIGNLNTVDEDLIVPCTEWEAARSFLL